MVSIALYIYIYIYLYIYIYIHTNPNLPTHPIPPSPLVSVCSLYLCLYFCFINKIFYPILFSHPTYILIFVFVFLTWFTLSDSLWGHPRLYRWLSFVPFYEWVILHRVYILHLLYSFICHWASRLFRCPGYCKQCCNEHSLGHMCLFDLWFSLGICPVVGLLGHVIDLFLVFKGTSILFSIVAISSYIPNNNTNGFSFLHTLSSISCL